MSTTTRFAREVTLGVKVESSYGVDAGITGSDLILCEVPEMDAVPVQLLERDVVSLSISPRGHIVGGVQYDFKIVTELKGSGTAGTAPQIDALLRAASLLKGTAPGSSVIYTPYTGADAVSDTIEVNESGVLKQGVGARTEFEFEVDALKFGKATFTGNAKYITPTNESLPTPNFSEQTAPPVIYNASFSIGSFAAELTSMKFKMNNKIARELNVNNTTISAGAFFISERKPTATLVFKAPLESEYAIHTAFENSTDQALTITCGQTAGNKIDFTGLVQYSSVKKTVVDGILYYTAEVKFKTSNFNTGNDEFNIKFY